MVPVKKPPHARNQTFIKEYRLAAGVSQAAVASALKIDQSTISKLESGKFPYGQDILEKLARLFGCTPIDLLAGPPGYRKVRTTSEIEIIADTARAMAQIYQLALRSDLVEYLAEMIESARAQRKALGAPEAPPEGDEPKPPPSRRP